MSEYIRVDDLNPYSESDPNSMQEPQSYRLKDIDLDVINCRQAYGNTKLDHNLNIKSASTQISALPQYIDPKTGITMKREYLIISPFYSEEYLNRCANAYLFDPVINSCIERLAYFTLGTTDEITSILYPESIRPLKSEFEAKNEIKKLKIIKSAVDVAGSVINNQLSDQEVSDFENYIHYTDKICKLGRFLKKNYRGAHVFSRSASFIQYGNNKIDDLGIPMGNPIGLVPLKPMHLGRVAINGDNFTIKGVEYTDTKMNFPEFTDVGLKQQANQGGTPDGKARFLDADRLLYFVRGNHNMMKDNDDFYFGHSSLQTILPVSEEYRRMLQIVIPAINQGHWASSGLWFFPNWTNAQMARFFSKLKPGAHTGVPQKDIVFQENKLTYDLAGLINLSNHLKFQILSVFGMPSFLMNFEGANTKATAETVVIGFTESTIQAERSWITDILDDQWYSKLFRIKYPDDEWIHIKLKMMVEFENISFETFFEKAVAVVSMIEKKVITLAEGRNMLKLPPLLPEDYAELGLSQPLVDPAAQGVPQPINPVVNMMQSRNMQMNAQTTDQSNTGTDNKFSSAMGSFNSALTEAKAKLLNPSG